MAKKIKISIPDDIYSEIEKRLKDYGFEKVEDYILFVLKESLKNPAGEGGLSEEEEEIIRKRLQDLGYIE